MNLDEAQAFVDQKVSEGYVHPPKHKFFHNFMSSVYRMDVTPATLMGHVLIDFLPETGITWQDTNDLFEQRLKALFADRSLWSYPHFIIMYASAWRWAGLWFNSSNIESRNIIMKELASLKQLQSATYNRQADIVDTLKRIGAKP